MSTLRKYEGGAIAASYGSTFNSEMEPLVRGSSVPRMIANSWHDLFSVTQNSRYQSSHLVNTLPPLNYVWYSASAFLKEGEVGYHQEVF